jgi:hypothetical protein
MASSLQARGSEGFASVRPRASASRNWIARRSESEKVLIGSHRPPMTFPVSRLCSQYSWEATSLITGLIASVLLGILREHELVHRTRGVTRGTPFA